MILELSEKITEKLKQKEIDLKRLDEIIYTYIPSGRNIRKII